MCFQAGSHSIHRDFFTRSGFLISATWGPRIFCMGPGRADGAWPGLGRSSPADSPGPQTGPQHLCALVVSSTVGSFHTLSGSGDKVTEAWGGRADPSPQLTVPHCILSRYLMKRLLLLQVPLLWWQWCGGILRGRGRGVIRQLPVHRRPDFFSRSPTQGWASLGPPVQAVAPLTLGENRGDADPSSSRISWSYPALLAAVPRLSSCQLQETAEGVRAA